MQNLTGILQRPGLGCQGGGVVSLAEGVSGTNPLFVLEGPVKGQAAGLLFGSKILVMSIGQQRGPGWWRGGWAMGSVWCCLCSFSLGA